MSGPDVSDWVPGSVFYQVFPERFRNGDQTNDPPGTRPWGGRPTRASTFGGDLQGVIDGLDHLQGLGVTGLYLTPIFASPSTHKYDTSDYFRVDPAFGTLETFQSLVKDVHARGMRIVLDGVFNHSGHRHAAFEDARRLGPASSCWNWYSFEGFPVRTRPKPNYKHAGIYYIPTWNVANPEVREHLLSAVRFWTEQGIDGWRLDVPWYIEGELGHNFWREFRTLVRGINPEAYLVGEHWGNASTWLQGDQFDGATDYRLRDLALGFALGHIDGLQLAEGLEALARAYPPSARLAMLNLVGSHDTPRVATLLHGHPGRLESVFTLMFTFPGVPLIYYGDEIGLRGGKDPDCRRPFPWEKEAWARDQLGRVRRLAEARRSHPALRSGEFRVVSADPKEVRFERTAAGRQVTVRLGRTMAEARMDDSA